MESEPYLPARMVSWTCGIPYALVRACRIYKIGEKYSLPLWEEDQLWNLSTLKHFWFQRERTG